MHAAAIICNRWKGKAQTLSFRSYFQFRLFITFLSVLLSLIQVLMAPEHGCSAGVGCSLARRAERHKLPLWLSFTWAETITRLNYSQATHLSALKVADALCGSGRWFKRGFAKGNSSRGEFTPCFQCVGCSPVPGCGSMILPNHSLPVVAQAQHRSGKGPCAT